MLEFWTGGENPQPYTQNFLLLNVTYDTTIMGTFLLLSYAEKYFTESVTSVG
jgi:hypothetical protein